MKQVIMDFLSQPAVITAIAALAAYLVARLFTAKPQWQQYIGLIINGVKISEKLIDENTENKAAARFNMALKVFIERFEAIYQKAPSPALIREVAANIPTVHADLEAAGNLSRHLSLSGPLIGTTE